MNILLDSVKIVTMSSIGGRINEREGWFFVLTSI